MAKGNPRKNFINDVLISELKSVHKSSPYLSFTLMNEGICFLGSCLGAKKNSFIFAVSKLDSLSKYRKILKSDIAKSLLVNPNVAVTNGHSVLHLKKDGDKTIINCENFYSDFSKACKEACKKMKGGDKQVLRIGKLTN